jgi:hypothetical protein
METIFFFVLLKTRFEKIKEANMNEKFPDEVDTPMDIPARVRFQK